MSDEQTGITGYGEAGSLRALKDLPRAKGLPWLGPLPRLFRDGFSYLLEARQKYGDIYLLDIGVMKMVMLNHPRHVHHVYVKRGLIYRKSGPLWDQMRRLTGNGLAVSQGEVWRTQRRIVQPLFHRSRLVTACELLNCAVNDELAALDDAVRSGQYVDIAPLLARITMKMTVRVVFGASLSNADVDELEPEMVYVIRYLLPAMLMNSLPRWAPRPGQRRYEQALRRIDALLMRVIAKRRAEGGDPGDLVSMLAQSEDNVGARMSEEQVRDETMTLFLAGYETTAIGLTWAVHYLSMHPDVMERMSAEVESVLGGCPPEFADLDKLVFTACVWNETLRLAPPIWWNPRRATEDDEIDGYSIPAGTTVAPLIYVVQRHPEVWEDPDRFDPNRFVDGCPTERTVCAWVPFGYGPRYCIGKDLAMLEAQIALARLAQRYHFEPDPEHRVQPITVGTLRPRNGIRVRIEERP